MSIIIETLDSGKALNDKFNLEPSQFLAFGVLLIDFFGVVLQRMIEQAFHIRIEHLDSSLQLPWLSILIHVYAKAE